MGRPHVASSALGHHPPLDRGRALQRAPGMGERRPVVAYGSLSLTQTEAVAEYVEGKVVHDICCGNFDLAGELLCLGASGVVAVDSRELVEFSQVLPSGIRYVQSAIQDFEEPIETLFVSWPVNWRIGLDRLVRRAATVIYLGSNVDGSACGGDEFWRAVTAREICVEIPAPKNTLLIYGGSYVVRELVPEEIAAVHHDRMYRYEELYGATA